MENKAEKKIIICEPIIGTYLKNNGNIGVLGYTTNYRGQTYKVLTTIKKFPECLEEKLKIDGTLETKTYWSPFLTGNEDNSLVLKLIDETQTREIDKSEADYIKMHDIKDIYLKAGNYTKAMKYIKKIEEKAKKELEMGWLFREEVLDAIEEYRMKVVEDYKRRSIDDLKEINSKLSNSEYYKEFRKLNNKLKKIDIIAQDLSLTNKEEETISDLKLEFGRTIERLVDLCNNYTERCLKREIEIRDNKEMANIIRVYIEITYWIPEEKSEEIKKTMNLLLDALKRN